MALNDFYYVNSSNGDFMRPLNVFELSRPSEGSVKEVLYSLVTPYIRRVLSESEFIHIKDNYGFMPIKNKKFKGHSFLKYSKINPPLQINYPTKQEIREFKLNNILK